MDDLQTRIDALEQVTSMTFDMANKMRHIMTRLDNYEVAYDKYLADVDAVRNADEINIEVDEK